MLLVGCVSHDLKFANCILVVSFNVSLSFEFPVSW